MYELLNSLINQFINSIRGRIKKRLMNHDIGEPEVVIHDLENEILQEDENRNVNEEITEEVGEDPHQVARDKLRDIHYIIDAIGYHIADPENPASYIDLLISRERVCQSFYLNEIRDYIPTLKEKYSSHSLTCLQSNAEEKQQYPNLNLLRQILKCNGFKLKSVVRSGGYNKTTGKKITFREYQIQWLK